MGVLGERRRGKEVRVKGKSKGEGEEDAGLKGEASDAVAVG